MLGWFSSDKCDNCGAEVEKGVKSKHCDHWICANCIVSRGVTTSHMFGSDTLVCPTCGEDTGLVYEKLKERMLNG